ncbi:unnamed protein product [Bemisia tabaci]|uniref:BHLH domain-containing protein n=1 Tax=Bemisia tabaci TaxID=7038 RepID=A0A9P0EZU0_BEMTA|nr:unnamed protein product [Bemisia tabaci]
MTNGKTSKQSKEYEKERRDRLNKAFDQLSSVLPDYDPISSLSKVEILTKAYDYIKKLEADQCKPSQTMDGSCEKENCNLRAKVKHLSSRIRQLMDVMYSAKIKVPDNLPPTSTYTPGNHCKWNGKAGDKKVELLLKSVLDKNKENKKNKLIARQLSTGKSKQVSSQAKKQARTSKLYQQKRKVFRLVETNDKLGSLSSIPKVVLSITDINAATTGTTAKSVAAPSCVVPLQESNSKVNIISTSSNVTEIKSGLTVNNKPVSLISAPIMATSITPTLPVQNFAHNSNVGTYILSNGQLMAVQQPAHIIPQIAPQILINRPVTPILLMQNNNNINSQPIIIQNHNRTREPLANNCRPIYPKTKREITRTTFSSQKPIPSLNLTFSNIKCTKEMRTEMISGGKQNRNKRQNSKLATLKKFSKDNIKNRNNSSKEKLMAKIDKETSVHKIKRFERINLMKIKLRKRKRKSPKHILLNKSANHGSVTSHLSSKRTSSSQSHELIVRKKSNLGSPSRQESTTQVNEVQISKRISNNSDATCGSQSSTIVTSSIESCDFINTSKSVVSLSLSPKGAFSSDSILSKNLFPETGEKVSCDLQLKTNSNATEALTSSQIQSYSAQNTNNSFNFDPKLVETFNFNSGKDVLTQLGTYEKNSFLPILPPYLEDVREFSSDILSSLQIPSNLHNSESLSPTAAFLLSFPLVSTSKNSELLNENENELSCESQNDNSTSIMQIGSLESPSSAIIEGQAVLFDQQFAQIPKPNWLSKSCDKIESNQKYNENLSFDTSNITPVHASNHPNKKSSVFGDSPCKAVSSKNKTDSSNGSNQHAGKNSQTLIDKISPGKKANIPATSSTADDTGQNVSIKLSSSAQTVTTCTTKELPKSLLAVSNNLLPVFSELYSSKTDKTACLELSPKSGERFVENSRKPSDKIKSKDNTLNARAFELSSANNSDVTKTTAKNCKEKINSSTVNENGSNNKSLVNWMTTPDVRLHGIEQFSNSELFPYQNFDFLASSTVACSSYSTSFTTTNIDQLFEYSSTTDNNKLYNPNYPAVLNQTNVWSPSKSSLPHHIVGTHTDNNFIIPSTLPTLIGDLALGTNTTPFVDAFKVASFEAVPDNYTGQKIGEPPINDNLKSYDRSENNQKVQVNTNENLSGARSKIKENINQHPCFESKQSAPAAKSQQPNKITALKKSESNDKSQQTSGTNFLSVSQLVDQNQVKSHGIQDDQVLSGSKRNFTHQKQQNKNSANSFNNFSNNTSEKYDPKHRLIKRGSATLNNGHHENFVNGNGQRVFNQHSIVSKTESVNNCWQHQSTKESSSLDTGFKSNNYSTESLLNSGNNHSQVMNFTPISDFHNTPNYSMDKSAKLQSSSVGNFFIPPAQPYQSNQQQLITTIPDSNPFGESFQFSNQSYRSDASISNEKPRLDYNAPASSSMNCLLSNKNPSISKSEFAVNFYPSTYSSSAPTKNSKERRTSCRQVADQKHPSNVELNHGIGSHISPPFPRPSLASSFSVSVSNSALTGPIYTNTSSSSCANKVEKQSVYYSNENIRKPCVSISDYAPFDDCNFKTPQNPLSITNAFIPPSSNNATLFLSSTSIPTNVLPSNFNSNSKSFPFLTPVVSTHSLSVSTNNMPYYTSSTASSSTSISTINANFTVASNTITVSEVSVCSSTTASNYLPPFIGSSTTISTPTVSFSHYLSPVITTSKNTKRTSSCSLSKSVTSSGAATYLPPIISTASISSNTNKISSYLPPVISTSSLVSTRNNTVANYLPNIIPSSSSADKNRLSNYLSPVIPTTNTLSNSNLTNYLPSVLPAVNDASLYLPLTSISTTGSSVSTQDINSSSSSYVLSTPTNTKLNAPSTQDKFAHNNTPSYQPYISNVPTSNSGVLNGPTTNHLPVFSNKTSDPAVSSSYLPVFSNTAGVTSSSTYLPIFSNSPSDLPMMSSSYLSLPTSNQGPNSVSTLNSAYTSNYLPSSSFSSSNYFTVNLNAAVPHDSQISNSTANFISYSAPSTVANTPCSSTDVQCSSNFSISSPAASRSSNKSSKTSPGSCKTFVSAKKAPNSAEVLNSEAKKVHSTNQKLNQEDTSLRTSNKENSSTKAVLKSCNPCVVSKGTSFPNSSCISNNLNNQSTLSSNQIESPAMFETYKPALIHQIGGNYATEHSSAMNVKGVTTSISSKTSLAPPMLPLNSGSAPSNNFSCIYSTSDSISYQPINLPNTFQNRPEFVDQVNIGPSSSFNNDTAINSIKMTPTSQKYVPSNEQLIYNATANSGSSTLTNFNLSAILPEMNDKIRCHTSSNSSCITRGLSEQTSFGKYDFYQYPEKKAHPLTDKKVQQMQHASQTVPPNQFNLSSKSSSSSFQNNLDTS